MRLTLNIDETLLAAAMDATGARTKTDAIHSALREVVRRHRLVALASEGMGMTADEIRNIYRPTFYWEDMRETPRTAQRLADEPHESQH